MIGAALRAAAAYVDYNATSAEWDPHQRLSSEQRFAKSERIRAVANELCALAYASEMRKIRYVEYSVFKDRLYAFGSSLTPKIDQDVASALREAEGPVRSREKGWLKPL